MGSLIPRPITKSVKDPTRSFAIQVSYFYSYNKVIANEFQYPLGKYLYIFVNKNVTHPAHWFDVVTARAYGSIEVQSSFFDIEVSCDGTAAPEFTCYCEFNIFGHDI